VADDRIKMPELPPAPMLQMDGIRIATLVTLAVNTVAVILLSTFLITSAEQQRQVNECYQGVIDGLQNYIVGTRETSAGDRQAQRELLLSMAAPDNGDAAVDRYLARLDELDRARSQNLPPAQRCAR
jgi:hypothetical protein